MNKGSALFLAVMGIALVGIVAAIGRSFQWW